MTFRPYQLLAPLLLTFILTPCIGKSGHVNVGIITALDATLEQLKKDMVINNYSTIGGRNFYQGKLGSTPVIIVRSPMGKVNNAITAQILISTYSPTSLLSISPAGSIAPDIRVGDVILATDVYQHDFGTWKPYGFIWSKTPAYIQSMSTNYNQFPNVSSQQTSKLSIASSRKATDANRIIKGTVVSGDQFIASPKKRDWLHKKFNAAAVDMGAAAIAQTCYVNRTPIGLIRVITDTAGLEARTTFADSMPAYRTTINLASLLEDLIDNNLQKE